MIVREFPEKPNIAEAQRDVINCSHGNVTDRYYRLSYTLDGHNSVVVRTRPMRYNCYISVAASRNGTGSHRRVTATLITPSGLHQAESDHVSVIVAGDFNCQPGSRLYGVLCHLINDNNLVVTDLSLLSVNSDSFTHCSDNGANTSWIDHVICSYAMDNTRHKMYLFRPQAYKLYCKLSMFCCYMPISINNNIDPNYVFHDWVKIAINDVYSYSDVLADQLGLITIPSTVRSCCHNRCNDPSHLADVDRYSNDVIHCFKYSVEQTIPIQHVCDNSFNVPG